MDKRKKVTLISAMAAALATSALVATAALATPAQTPAPADKASAVASQPAEAAETDGVNHEFDGEEVGNNGDGVADAGDALETK
jgi:hypothetical protein